MGIQYHLLPPMAIDLPVCDDVPMKVTVTGYAENYDWLGLGGNLACFLSILVCHEIPHNPIFVLLCSWNKLR